MKTITLTEMREALALSCVENIYKDRELMAVYMDGFTGYNNESDEDILDWYTQMFLPDMDVDDFNSVEVLTVVSEENQSQVLYRITQQEGEFTINKVGE